MTGHDRSRAVVLERFGELPTVTEFEVPPAGPGEAVVACSHGGICGTDVHLVHGDLDVPVPLVLGHEGLGTVVAVDDGVLATDGRPLAEGETVMWASSISCGRCPACVRHREPTLCRTRRTYGVNRSTSDGSPLSGSWADAISLRPGTTIVRLPAGIDPIAAISFACAGPTMIHALRERRSVRLGEVVVVQGSGPVGLAAAALAQLAGAFVVVAGGPAARLDAAKRAGIGDVHVEVVESGDVDAAIATVHDLTGGLGADLVIEAAGVPAAVDQGTRMARRGGSYLVVGQYTDSGNAWFNPHQIVYRQLDVIGSWAFTGAHLAQYVEVLPALAERFDLASLVTTFALGDVHEALARVEAGDVLKAVLVP